MPNGDDKNWVRICGAIDGFRSRYGEWPTKVRLDPGSYREIRDHILSPKEFEKIAARVKFIPEESEMIAEDNKGRQYNYSQEGFPDPRPEPTTREWVRGIV